MRFKKEYICLALILILSIILRALVHRDLMFITYDEYIHKFLTVSLANNNFQNIDFSNIKSLIGLSAYSYPPFFHILGALIYKIFKTNYIFYILPVIYGTLSTLIYYLIAKYILKDYKKAALATLLFTTAPNVLYRTSIYIPENLGILLFLICLYFFIKTIKERKIIYSIFFLFFLAIYMVTHRGWLMLIFSIFLIVIPYILEKLNMKKIIIISFFLIPILAVPIILFPSLLKRLPRKEVSLLGYFKWVGLIQLIFGLLGIKKYLYSKDALKRGLALWALAFLLIGSISFRFRDPYSSIPICIIAADYLMYILPQIIEKVKAINIKIKKITILPLILIILLPTTQALATIFTAMTPITIKDKNAFEWIKENTPKNSVFLTWWNLGYFLIGETGRRDLVTWTKVCQGFFGKAPSIYIVNKVYDDMVTMFSSPYKNQVYYLFNKYNVSYVLLDKSIRQYGLVKYGLAIYCPYDTHFKLVYADGNAEIYKYYNNPKLGKFEVKKSRDNKIITYLENFWTGYNFADFNINKYTAYFGYNALILNILKYYNKTKQINYMLKWFSYKQMNNGCFVNYIPPKPSIYVSSKVYYYLKDFKFSGKEKLKSYLINYSKDLVYNISNNKPIDLKVYQIASALPYLYLTNITNKSENEKIVDYIIKNQHFDGSWGDNIFDTIQTAYSLSIYYKYSKDPKVYNSLKKCVSYLKSKLDNNWLFKDRNKRYYSKATYAKMMFIFNTTNTTNNFEHIVDLYNPYEEFSPMCSLLDIYEVYLFTYNNETIALDKINSLLGQKTYKG
ncbi:hypothetical protein [Methanocaldococcus sp.]